MFDFTPKFVFILLNSRFCVFFFDKFQNNTEGALKIHMSAAEEADAVVGNFNGRYFGGRRLEAYTWDGFEKLNVVETEAERKKRLERWEKYVDDDDEDEGGSGGVVKKARLGGDATPPPNDTDRGLDSDDDDKYFD